MFQKIQDVFFLKKENVRINTKQNAWKNAKIKVKCVSVDQECLMPTVLWSP